MIAITKGVLALSALASAGLVAFDASTPAIDPNSATYQVSHRFPRADENFARVVPVKPQADGTKAVADGRKGDRLESCGQREWPYIAQACLVSSNGSPVRKISRVVAIERRLADNAAEVAIVPAAFASR